MKKYHQISVGNNFRLLLILIPLLILLAVPYGCIVSNDDPPQAKMGLLNLTDWNFYEQDRVNLDGEWKIYWQQILTPEEIAALPDGEQDQFYSVPNSWNNFKKDNTLSAGTGYATFILKIRIPKHKPPLYLEIREILTSYKLWVNNKIVCRRGVVGTNRQTSIPEFQPDIVPIVITDDTITLVLQVSNFHHRKGGPWTSIQLGSAAFIKESYSKRLFINIFLVGSIFMIGFYHLSLFLLRDKYTSSLYFGIFCILISIRSIVTNERYFHVLFPNLTWLFLMRIEYLTFYLAIPVFGMFIVSVFPKDFSKKILYLISAVSLIFSGIVCVTPVLIFSHTIQYFQVVTLISAVYLFFVFLKAYRMKREGTVINLAGFTILFLTVINDVLYVNEIIDTYSLIPFGMLFFIFSQSFLISLIYSRSFKKVETQKKELGVVNLALGKEIQANKVLQANLVQSHNNFQKSRVALILGLAKLAEYRDEDTGAHLKRIREFSILIATGLSKIKKYENYISKKYIDDIYQSSILHDIGKVGIKDAILLKPGKLTPEEFDVIKTHSTIGGDAITLIEFEFNAKSFLTLGRNIAYSHHERWDGTGYPNGLKEEKIPLSARIVAVADVYDALTSERSYKKAFSHDKAKEIIIQGRANHFDPDIVDMFVQLSDGFVQTRYKFPD